MGANAKLFYDAFRGLCRMRIAYAQNQINFLAWEKDYFGLENEKPLDSKV